MAQPPKGRAAKLVVNMLREWILVVVSTASLVAISTLALLILYVERNNTAGVVTIKVSLTIGPSNAVCSSGVV